MASRFSLWSKISCTAAAAAVALMAASFPISALEGSALRCARENDAGTSDGGVQSLPERLRLECPLLSHVVEEFALRDLGEVASSGALDFRTREIAMVAAFAALGDSAGVKRHARYALASGATKLEVEELLYLTAVYAGVPKAIEAARAISELFTERGENGTAH